MIAVMLGGCLGTFLRFIITERLKGRTLIFPSGVLVINLGGSFLIGLLVGLGMNTGAQAGRFIFTGCLGAFTTFSTFSVEAVELWKERKISLLFLYLLLSLLGSVIFCLVGFWLGHIAG